MKIFHKHKFTHVPEERLLHCDCAHEWETIMENKVYEGLDARYIDGNLPIGTKYTLKCSKCGEMDYHINY